MPSLNSIVNVQIQKTSVNVSQQGFGIPLILGYHTRFVDDLRAYTSVAAMVTDGFLTTDLEYLAASAAFAQNPSPTEVIVGRRAAAPVQTVILTPTAVNLATYNLVINGIVCPFTADGTATAAEVCTGIAAAVTAASGLSGFLTATAGATTVTLTGATGNGFTYAFSATLGAVATLQDTTADAGIATDLGRMLAASKDWYGIVLTQRGKAEVLAAAAWTEANKRLLIASTNDSDYKSSATTDMATALKNAAYLRTATIFSVNSGDYACSAWLGKMLPQTPGSADFIYKTLAGVSASSLTDTEVTNITGKNGNYYITQNNVNITVSGCVASGEWLDITLGIDWLSARLQERIFALLASQPKVPYTDAGIQTVVAEILAQLQEGAENGFLTPGAFTVSAPRAKNVSPADKTSRTLNNVTFTAQLAGSIHIVKIVGTVTV